MFEDDACRFWCLFDRQESLSEYGEGERELPFSVDASLKWDVDQLTKAIQQEKSLLRNTDTTDLVLWKLNDPISVDPDPTLAERLPKPITDFSVKLDLRTRKVSDVLPDRPEGHLHIIVRLRGPTCPPIIHSAVQRLADQADEREAKRVKLEDQRENDKSLAKFRHFRNYHWGENRIKVRTEGGRKCSTLDLTCANLSELNRRSIEILFIRDEYELAYNAIAMGMSPEERVIFLLTGQPGTGKTLFLLVFLILSLREKQTVALQINADEFVLFDEGGVSKHRKHDTFAIPKGAWTLSDSQSGEPCTAFQFSEGHLLHTSSPASERWKEWVKQLSATRYVMDVWSLEEFRTLLTVSNVNIPRGETLFLKYGSNVRSIIDILKKPVEENAYDQDVQNGAADIARDFSTVFLKLERLDFSSKLSSKIFAVRPENLELRLPVLTIPTPYLFKTLATAVSRQELVQQHAIFTSLTAHPSLGTAAGWWFENYAHVTLSDPTRPPIQTHIRSATNPPFIPAPKAVLAGTDALRKIKPPFDFYWRPREPNFEGIDYLIRIGNKVRVGQYTTSSSHRSATKGLDEIYKVMNHKKNVVWHFDIVGPELSVAESARDSHKLTGRWVDTPIYSSQLTLGILDKPLLERVLNEATNETYPGYPTTGFQLSSSSTPFRVPSGSTMGHVERGSTGAPPHQSARVSTRRKGRSGQNHSKAVFAPPTDTVPPRRSLRRLQRDGDSGLSNTSHR